MPEATISSENLAASTSAIPSKQETHGASTSLIVSSSPRTKLKSDKNELDDAIKIRYLDVKNKPNSFNDMLMLISLQKLPGSLAKINKKELSEIDKNIYEVQLNVNIISSSQKNNLYQYLKRNPSSIENKKSTTDKKELTSNQSSSIKSVNTDVSCSLGPGDHIQQHSKAPTLPIHSPHSPLLCDESANYHLKKTKLSARYINNTSFNATNDNSMLGTETSSKLICYCEKRGEESLECSNKKMSVDFGVAKRLVPTRNAATSPHLDIRKLGSMTTVTPSPSLTNDLCFKLTDCRKNQSKIHNATKIVDERNNKKVLHKLNSIGESKDIKLLRTTRSLSPRPPIRHQHAILVSETRNADMQYSRLSSINARTNKQQISKVCRSEQSSPNVIDGTEIQFSYNESANRSTGCLGNVYSDPWLKITSADNMSSSNLSANKEKRFNPASIVLKSNDDPWVKRADIESLPKSSRYELFRQSKSFSVSKFDVDPYLWNSTKSPCHLNNEKNGTSVINVKTKLRSAPSSPHFLTAPLNMFTSSTYPTNPSFNEKTPTRSSSFSPARIKDNNNPFTDYTLHRSNSPPPSISVAAEIIDEQNKSKSKLNIRSTNYEFLNVCNPLLLNARHSFSSVSEKQQGEELQLNIRRLSDQMHRADTTLTNSIKTFSSDCYVRENRKDENKALCFANDTKEPNIGEGAAMNRADFSDYLEQFRCSEAKKAAVNKERSCLWREKNKLTKSQINQPIAINKTQQSSDCLLETTC
ncbi:hypothetical protein FF38_10086 [Lucilia cuprina]|uniref:Uncharacterized protein n=1 Tax=Lucilia cuprina TaxID=7375 RepID=A0A0L0CHD9_LUCCU|nr:hypothetical protein FF38_10086 [Lucilia cuprina]